MSAQPAAGPAAARRLDWVDAGRGLAIALVALFHSTNWLRAAKVDVDGWTQFSVVVSSLRMPLFFTISGLFAAKWIRGAWRPLWTHKLRLYLWVFLLWGLVGSFTYWLGVTMKDQGSLKASVIKPYLMSPVVPRLELWFIWALALYFILAKLTRRIPVPLQIGVAAAASVFALSGWDTRSPGWDGGVKYYAFFLVGLYWRELVIRVGATPRKAALGAVFVLWAVVAVGLWAAGLREVLGLYFVNCVLGVLAGIGLSRVLAGWAGLRSLGSKTLPVYVAHTPIAIVCAFLVSLTPMPAFAWSGLVLPPLVALVAILASLALHRVAQQRGAGWLYAPPRWFDVPPRRAAAVADVVAPAVPAVPAEVVAVSGTRPADPTTGAPSAG